jgi:hypothetical protein
VSIIRTPPQRRPRSSGEKFDVCLVSRVRNAVISSSSELEQDMERADLEGAKKQLLLGAVVWLYFYFILGSFLFFFPFKSVFCFSLLLGLFVVASSVTWCGVAVVHN